MRKASKTDYGYNSTFPRRLRKIMDDNKTTQAILANECGVERQSVAQWRDGNTRPDILSLRKIAEFYNVSTDYLLGLTDEKTTDKATKELCATLGLTDSSISYLTDEDNQFARELIDFLIEDDIEHIIEDQTKQNGETTYSFMKYLYRFFDAAHTQENISISLSSDGHFELVEIDEEGMIVDVKQAETIMTGLKVGHHIDVADYIATRYLNGLYIALQSYYYKCSSERTNNVTSKLELSKDRFHNRIEVLKSFIADQLSKKLSQKKEKEDADNTKT